MTNEYSIKDIINLLVSKLWLVIIAAVLGGTGAFMYTKYRMPLQYSSHISMYVQSYTTVSKDTEEKVNNINYSKQLINTYIEVLKADAVLEAVADDLEKTCDGEQLIKCFGVYKGISPGAIRGTLNITSVSDTSALNVSTVTRDPEIAAAICNSLAKVAPDYLQDAVGVGEINTIDTARVYFSPVGPNFRKNALLGFVAGGILVVLIVFLIDFFDNTIKDPEFLHRRFKKSIIGEVQEYSEKNRKRRGVSDSAHIKLTDENVPFGVVESYKSIRTNIHFTLSTSDKKIFAISSPNPNEGKSTMSANIAIAMAQSGTKVLLIDADMRKSSQHRIFKLGNKKGLSTVISRMDSLEFSIKRDVEENLDILTAGPVPPNPSELLASANMAQMLNSLSESYGCIILDTPPLNMVTDALALADKVAGMVVVVRYGVTTNDEIDQAMKKLNLASMNILGFVINEIKGKKPRSYRDYKYKKGYGYGYGYRPSLITDQQAAAGEENPVPEEPAKTDSTEGTKDSK